MKPLSRTDLLITLQPVGPQRALLRFELKEQRSVLEVVLANADQRLSAMKQSLPVLMERFRQAIHPQHTVLVDDERLEAALGRLNALAYGTLDLMLARAEMPTSKQGRVTAQSFVRALSTYIAPALARRSMADPLMVEVSADDDFPLAWYLPVELLPISLPQSDHKSRQSAKPVVPDDFLGFLGMQAIVARRRRPVTSDFVEKGAKVPLSVAAFRGQLQGVQEQLDYFTSRGDSFATGPKSIWPWDDDVGIDQAVGELASVLSATQAAPSQRRGRPVMHFCCHYRAHGANGPGLGFASDLEVAVGELRGVIAAPPFLEPIEEHAGRPLVFINACESANWGGGAESLLQFLFDRGYYHVIGGETTLPDLVASEFARRVYDYALSGKTIGECILRSRQDLLRVRRNPAGLLYTYYGSPDIRIH